MAPASCRPAVVCLSLLFLLWLTSGMAVQLWAQDAKEPPADAAPPGALVDESTETGSAPSSVLPIAALAGMMGVFLLAYFVFIMLVVLITLGGLILSCLAVYDCARRDFADPNTRAMWCLIIALTRLIGAVIYYFVVYRKNDPPIQPPR